MSKILYLDEARQHTLSAGPKHLMRLVPGRNVVDDEVYDAVLNSMAKGEKTSRLQDMIDSGVIKVAGETVDISKMKMPEALYTIELETTVEGLDDLLEQEQGRKDPRKTIVSAIESAIDAIDHPPSADDED
jgi:hypothetical protein